MHFRVKVQNRDIIGDAKISFFFGGGCLKFLMFFGGWTVDAGMHPTYEEKMRVPPLPPPSRVLQGIL